MGQDDAVLDESSEPAPVTFLAIAPVAAVTAVTDAARVIPLFRYEVSVIPANHGQELEFRTAEGQRKLLRLAERQFLQNAKQDHRSLVRIAEPLTISNCHGWIFAGGQFGIEEKFMPLILSDNGYVAIDDPRAGDIAIYRHGPDISHSCIVQRNDRGSIIVQSKWGPFGVFEHRVEAYPFGGDRTFYRSHRAGHLLTLKAGQA